MSTPTTARRGGRYIKDPSTGTLTPVAPADRHAEAIKRLGAGKAKSPARPSAAPDPATPDTDTKSED
jgi:hypothetical protein